MNIKQEVNQLLHLSNKENCCPYCSTQLNAISWGQHVRPERVCPNDNCPCYKTHSERFIKSD